jgi:hypothetical protein
MRGRYWPGDPSPPLPYVRRDARSGLHRILQRGTSGSGCQLFTRPPGQWIRLLGRCGLVVEDLIEVQVRPGATSNDFPELPDEWGRRWPAEEVWFARRPAAA